MVSLCFSPSSTAHLLPNSIDFYAATIFFPKPLFSISKNERSRKISLYFLNNRINQSPELRSRKWRTGVSFFSSFLDKNSHIESVKQELLDGERVREWQSEREVQNEKLGMHCLVAQLNASTALYYLIWQNMVTTLLVEMRWSSSKRRFMSWSDLFLGSLAEIEITSIFLSHG